MKKLLALLGVSCWVVVLAAGNQFFDLKSAKSENFVAMGKGSWTIEEDRMILTIPVDPDNRWPGVIVRPLPGCFFDFSANTVMAVDVRNLSDLHASLQVEVVNLDRSAQPKDLFRYRAFAGIGLAPYEKATLRVRYGRIFNRNAAAWAPVGLQSLFDGFDWPTHRVEPEQVDQLRFFIFDGVREHRFELSNFRLEEPFQPLSAALGAPETFYPYIDRYGQYKHRDWPGKIHSDEDFAVRKDAEAQDLAAHPGPSGRDEFGGWEEGPAFPVTGNFYPVKYQGKWYLVDPKGKLFWSYGMDCVNLAAWTGVTLREHHFEALPPRTPENRRMFGVFRNAPIGFYRENKVPVAMVDHLKWNCQRKYGADYWNTFPEVALRRLRSWGFNSLGNWSHDAVLNSPHRLPYAVTVETAAPLIEGDRGWWHNFYEVFSPDFAAGLERDLKTRRAAAVADPYCIGFFVSNELSWGDEVNLVRGVIRSPAKQLSKQEFSKRLQEKYHSIAELNRAWGADYRDWNHFLEVTELPDEKLAWGDMAAFNQEMVERYFRLVSETLQRCAPGKLYLGCRFPNDYSERVVRAAADYVDVLSFNFYKYSVADFKLPQGIDKPVIIGEFHFGTVNDGLGHPGLCPVADQRERGRALERYVESALSNPYFIGCHYFLYHDEAPAGRPNDGENFQIGFVDVADTPYQDIIDSSRKIGESLYRMRSAE